jgi:hypothetical protein
MRDLACRWIACEFDGPCGALKFIRSVFAIAAFLFAGAALLTAPIGALGGTAKLAKMMGAL